MWCYQKPGFEALLLTELQRQQQCSQFCDTMLKTGGVSVPAHSCILSAISPHISSALSSTPPPSAGQSRLLEFRALGSCSLLHLVRLLYSGEMAGEGEEEKREAVSAAAMLGIHGLVEVTRRDRKNINKDGDGRHVEVGVQTEMLMPEEKKGCRWRREVRGGSTFLWKEMLSDGEKDTWTQTEELQENTAPPSCPAASFETIDMAVLQSLGQTDPHLLPPQIPYVPLSLICPPGETQIHQPAFAPMDSMQESTAAGHTSVAAAAPLYASIPPPHLPLSSQATTCSTDPQIWWAGPQRVSRNAEEWEDKQFEQFQGNIPGYINHFLNMDKEQSSRRRRARGRQRAGGSRRAGTGERRARRPRGRTAGRGRGGLTQTVDVQEVGVSGLHKLFLQRWGMRASRTGQGGGAAGRKLYLKSRELLNAARSCQRRRGRRKAWEFSPSGDVQLCEGGAHHKQRGRRKMTQQFNQDDQPVVRAQRTKAKPAASYVHRPASSLLHTTSIPPPNPPAHEEQPEHFDRLLEEVMMGLHILPNNNCSPCSQPPLPTSSDYTLAQNRQQGQATGLLDAGPGFHESTQVDAGAVGAGGSSSANSEPPVLQQQGELNDMLEHFLQSFEQHLHSCIVREEVEVGGQSCKEASVQSSQTTEQQQNDEVKTPARAPHKTSSARGAVPPKHTEETPGKARARARRQARRTKNQYLLPLERVMARKPASLSDARMKVVHDKVKKQLQQTPKVKLERSGPLQGPRCQHVEVKSPKEAKISSSSGKCPCDTSNQPVPWKTYPIRSWLRKSHIDSKPCLVEPLPYKRPASARQPSGRQGRPSKNRQLLGLTNGESSTPPVQTQPVDQRPEKNQERREEELTVQPQEEEAEGPPRRGMKRGAESEEETNEDGTVAKRVCFEPMPQASCQMCTADLEPAATETQDVINVKTVSLTSVGNCLQKGGREENPVWSEIKLRETEESLVDEGMEGSGDEIIDVDGDVEDDAEQDRRQSRTAPTLSHVVDVEPSVSLGSTEDKDEDIDVIGGSSPVLDTVIIDWTESSEDEEEDEDVDVVGETTDCTSSEVFVTMSEEAKSSSDNAMMGSGTDTCQTAKDD